MYSKSSGHATPKYAALVYLFFWAEDTWKVANAGIGLLWTPYLQIFLRKTHKSPPLGVYPTKEGRFVLQERRLELHTTPKLYHKLLYLPSIILMALSYSLKIICSPINCLHLLSSFPIIMIYKLSNLTDFLAIHFPSIMPLYM